MTGERPAHPVALAELGRSVYESCEPEARDYVFGGAGAEDTMRANDEAFRRWRIVPRMLCDVSERDLRATVLGSDLPAPVALAPIASQTIVHADGELAVARAAGRVGVAMAASTLSSFSMEEIAAAGTGPKWFQLYWPTNRELAASFVNRAETAGYGAVIVTVDVAAQGWKPRDLQHAYQPILQGIGMANYTSDPVFRAMLPAPPEDDSQAAIGAFVGQFPNPRLTWDDIEFLRSSTTLPIAVKGILHPDDARMARERGVDAVVVSNHGGRQVDGAIASLDALPGIADAVAGDLQILLDSGIRGGADVVKALALGADAVLLGRPYLWGLAAGGEEGVVAVIRSLLAELELTLGLSGHTTPGQLGAGVLTRADAR